MSNLDANKGSIPLISVPQANPQARSSSDGWNRLRVFLACCVLPVTLNYFAYYGFVTNQSRHVFTRADFIGQYDWGVFRYRVLGRKLLLLVYSALEHFHHPAEGGSRTARFLETNNLNLYHSYFLLNTTFMCLTLWMLALTFQLNLFRVRPQEKFLLVLVTAFLIAMTQFVVVPYDTLAYFFLTLSIYLMLLRPTPLVVAGLILVVVLGSLTRETAALTLSVYAALYVLRRQTGVKATLSVLAALAAAFAVTYVALRVHYGWQNGVGNVITLGVNLHRHGLVGAAFLVSTLVLLSDFSNAVGRRAVWLFLAFSSPYLLSILLTGVLFEARLGVPLFIGVVVLANLPEAQTEASAAAAGS